MSRTPTEALIGAPLPDVSIPATDGTGFGLRNRVGLGPLALFLYIRNGTPG